MDAWLRDIGTGARGAGGSDRKACTAGRARLRDGETARVERAVMMPAFRGLTSGYIRAGTGAGGTSAGGRATRSPVPAPLLAHAPLSQ